MSAERAPLITVAIASMIAGMVGLSITLVVVLRRNVLRPLTAIHRGAEAIARGELSYRLPINGADEIDVVAHELNRMASQVQAFYGQVAEEQYKVLMAIEASPDGIWVSDTRRRITVVNSALERLIGRPRDQLLDQPCCGLLAVRALDGSQFCAAACPFLHPGTRMNKAEGRLTTTSGGEIWVEISYGLITNQTNDLVGVMHVVHDLTQRKELEHLKDELLATVSHELRTPLHHIKGFASTLLQTDVSWDPAVQHDFLASIDREADRLAQLVEKILDLSRLESGQFLLRRVPCSATELLDGALAHTRTITGGRAIRVFLPNDLPTLVLDDVQIERVLVNLIENAVKYSDPGTPLDLRVEHAEGKMYFAVEDQGIGIAPEHLERIFERFYRVGTRPVSGTGLGLAICKRIVEAHGGWVFVESTSGVGSRFTFQLAIDGAGGLATTHPAQPVENGGVLRLP